MSRHGFDTLPEASRALVTAFRNDRIHRRAQRRANLTCLLLAVSETGAVIWLVTHRESSATPYVVVAMLAVLLVPAALVLLAPPSLLHRLTPGLCRECAWERALDARKRPATRR